MYVVYTMVLPPCLYKIMKTAFFFKHFSNPQIWSVIVVSFFFLNFAVKLIAYLTIYSFTIIFLFFVIRFDEYLKRALQDSPPLRLSSSVGHEGSRYPSNRSLDEDFLLRDGIERLEGELEASRRASRIEELRLKTLLSL